jgi:hypothetical protein
MSDFKMLTYDAVEVGEEFISDDHLITPEDVETYAVHGTVVDKTPENGATRITVEVWVENQHGDKTMVGTASGLAS